MDGHAADAFIEPLTNREMDVLRLLADGLSNQEIAERLVFEVGTVKWYTNQIYGKLQVKTRTQAVVRAQTLGILEVEAANPLHRPQHNLPADTLPFIGRVREIGELAQQLTSDKFRLITILGPGGMGKTRLSIEVGRRLTGYFADGVYFVPLAAVTSAEHMVTTIAESIGFKFYSDTQPDQQLLDHLQKRHMLLIIDNFEHLLESAGLLSDILKTAPDVKLLVTSREKLGLGGEVVYVIGGLATPFVEGTEIAAHDAVKLFIEAASRTAHPIEEANIGVVATICRLLGGMPLGILLAAAWVDTLTLAEIEAELRRGLGILEATLRDAPQRHQSIEAVFDYSWQRLSTDEQNVFMRLSVFRDGFTREAAQAVAGASIRDLQRLVHTSFVQHLPSGRYAIHELMRQYGEQKLKASGELTAIRERHAQFFAGFIAPLGEITWQMASPDMLEAVNADFENVRAAWQFYAESKDIGGLRQLLDGTWHFIDSYSRTQEGINLFEPILDLFRDEGGDDVTLFRGQVMTPLGWLYVDTVQKAKGHAILEQAIRILQPFGTTNALLQAYVGLNIALYFSDSLLEGLEVLEKGYELSRQMGEQKWQPVFRRLIGLIYVNLGMYDEAQKWLEEPTSRLLNRLGEYARAEEVLLKDLEHVGRHRYNNILRYCDLIENAVLTRQYEKAWLHLHRGLHYIDDKNYAWGALEMLEYALMLFIAEQRYEAAVELLSLIVHHPAATEMTRAHVTKHENALKASLPAETFAAAWERGQRIDLGDLITELMER